MASRLMVQQQKMGEARPVNAANKQKNIAAAGKANRRALGDIGNLVTVRPGKPLLPQPGNLYIIIFACPKTIDHIC
ncbi:G2/mitotic-specific cyclin-1 [Orobanche gracilis]